MSILSLLSIKIGREKLGFCLVCHSSGVSTEIKGEKRIHYFHIFSLQEAENAERAKVVTKSSAYLMSAEVNDIFFLTARQIRGVVADLQDERRFETKPSDGTGTTTQMDVATLQSKLADRSLHAHDIRELPSEGKPETVATDWVSGTFTLIHPPSN